MITVDARCFCMQCEARSKNVYRMFAYCRNCGQGPIIVLFREGDPKRDVDCPTCGVWHGVRPIRLASPEEMPASEPA